jgi:hypothetical protein
MLRLFKIILSLLVFTSISIAQVESDSLPEIHISFPYLTIEGTYSGYINIYTPSAYSGTHTSIGLYSEYPKLSFALGSDLLIPSSINGVKYLVGGIFLKTKEAEATSSWSEGYVTSTLNGGGIYTGICLTSGWDLNRIKLGIFGKVAIGYFSFEQRMELHKRYLPGRQEDSTIYNIKTTPSIGSLFNIGIMMKLGKIKLMPGFICVLAGQKDDGLIRIYGFDFSLGFEL